MGLADWCAGRIPGLDTVASSQTGGSHLKECRLRRVSARRNRNHEHGTKRSKKRAKADVLKPAVACSTECCRSETDQKITEMAHMKIVGIAVLVCSLTSFAFAVEHVVTATHGTITKIDRAAKTIAVKTADGTEHLFYWAKDTSVHGVKAADLASKDSWHGLKEGSEVVAHSTERGSKDTAVEVDKVGDNGLKRTEGTVKEIDRHGKKLVIESADGTEHAFKLTDHAATDAGKNVAAGVEKGTKVAIYSTEEAGQSVAHFFEKI